MHMKSFNRWSQVSRPITQKETNFDTLFNGRGANIQTQELLLIQCRLMSIFFSVSYNRHSIFVLSPEMLPCRVCAKDEDFHTF